MKEKMGQAALFEEMNLMNMQNGCNLYEKKCKDNSSGISRALYNLFMFHKM